MERGNVGDASESAEGTMFDEALKISLIMRYPEIIPEDMVVDSQVQTLDIFPTVFDMLGLEIPKNYQGKSLLPLIKGDKKKIRDYAFSEGTPGGYQQARDDMRMMKCVRSERWKLIKYENIEGALELAADNASNVVNFFGAKRGIMREREKPFKDKLKVTKKKIS